MGLAFDFGYFGLCAIVFAGVGLIWLVLVLVGAWRLRCQQRRLSSQPRDELPGNKPGVTTDADQAHDDHIFM